MRRNGSSGQHGLAGAKWLELLKEVEPRLVRVGVLRDATLAAGIGQFAAIQAVAPSIGVEAVPINMRDTADLERGIDAMAGGPKSGLIVTAGTLTTLHRDLIVSQAAKHHLPAIYSNRLFVAAGGLMSYSPDRFEQIQRAAVYIDRIMKGEKPADLPVQAPTRYELAINLTTAKALALIVPPTLVARAEEVIE
jgi:putative tryptophan/tyrosine transport system substrate-binding protein